MLTMTLQGIWAVAAILAVLSGRLSTDTGAENGRPENRELLLGTWTAEMVLPGGTRLLDREKFKSDGFATGRILTYFRDGTLKASTSYSFSWRLEGRILVSEGIVRVPPRPELADSSRDEVVQLDADQLVLRDLSNRIVVYYKRVR